MKRQLGDPPPRIQASDSHSAGNQMQRSFFVLRKTRTR